MRACSLIFILTATAGTLSAQWPSGVTSGARVQLRLPEVQYQFIGSRGLLVRGRVAALTPDTLYLSVTDSLGPLPIPRGIIDGLQVSRGVPSRLNNALRSGLISAVGVSLLSIAFNETEEGSDRTSVGTAALVGAGVGLAVGAITGAIFPTERWKRVKL